MNGSVSKIAGVNQLANSNLAPFSKEDRELAAFGAHPEAVFAAKGVHVGKYPPGGDQFAVDPAVAEAGIAIRGAGHDAALPCGNNGDAAAPCGIAQDNNLRVNFKKAVSPPNVAADTHWAIEAVAAISAKRALIWVRCMMDGIRWGLMDSPSR